MSTSYLFITCWIQIINIQSPLDASYADPMGSLQERPKTSRRLLTESEFADVEVGQDLLPLWCPFFQSFLLPIDELNEESKFWHLKVYSEYINCINTWEFEIAEHWFQLWRKSLIVSLLLALFGSSSWLLRKRKHTSSCSTYLH